MVTRKGSRPASAEQRLKELGIKLPAPPEPFGTYVEAVQTGNLLFLTGMLPTEGHGAKFIGRGARYGSGAQGGSSRCAERPRCRQAAFGVPRQSDADHPAWRVRGYFGRCPRSTDGCRRRFGVAARHLEKDKSPCRLVYGVASLPLGARSSWKSILVEVVDHIRPVARCASLTALVAREDAQLRPAGTRNHFVLAFLRKAENKEATQIHKRREGNLRS